MRVSDFFSQQKVSPVSGVDLAYYELGDKAAPTLVFLHGFLGASLAWLGLIPYLQSAYHLVFLDLPGFGGSGPLSSAVSVEALCEVIYAFLVRQDLLDSVLVGTQIGASVSVRFAARYPQAISRLVLLSAGALGEQGQPIGVLRLIATPWLGDCLLACVSKRYWVKQWLAIHGASFVPDPLKLACYMEQFYVAGCYGMRVALRIRQSFGSAFDRYVPDLQAIEVPVLCLFGQDDVTIPDWAIAQFKCHLSRGTIVRLPGCGNVLHDESPEAVSKLICQWMKAGFVGFSER